MILKVNGFELEISTGSDIYLALPSKGQTFKNWTELDEDVKADFELIQNKAMELIKQSEEILVAAST